MSNHDDLATRPARASGFHDGEILVQERSGVRAEAGRLERMLEPAALGDGAAAFLRTQTFALLCARDHDGRLWLSPLPGPPGFVRVLGPTTVQVGVVPRAGDPLHDLPPGQQVGLLVIDLGRRRRYRLNGTLTEGRAPQSDVLLVEVDQAYGNCPQYIQQRTLAPAPGSREQTPASGSGPRPRLTEADVEQVAAADTFFLGTAHPDRGADASHRGGTAGFVRVTDGGRLWWPDHPGNNMFNSLGNLAVDPAAALLFCDFTNGRTLHLTGTAVLEHTEPGAPGDDGGTGRRTRFTPSVAQQGPPLTVRAAAPVGWPGNPPLT